MQDTTERWKVSEESEGERLDSHIAGHLQISRSQASRWIAESRVEIGGRGITRVSRRVHKGEEIACTPLPIDQAGRHHSATGSAPVRQARTVDLWEYQSLTQKQNLGHIAQQNGVYQ